MRRLIDANALRESFEKNAYKCEYIEDMVFHLDAIIDAIDNAPTVDAVEVEKYNALREDLENLKDEIRILSQKRANIFEITSAYERGMVAGIKDFAKKLCEDRVSNDPVVIAVKTELKMRGTDNV